MYIICKKNYKIENKCIKILTYRIFSIFSIRFPLKELGLDMNGLHLIILPSLPDLRAADTFSATSNSTLATELLKICKTKLKGWLGEEGCIKLH